MVQILHIGLPKCGSTTLQELWNFSTNCELLPIHEFVKEANQSLLQSNGDMDCAIEALLRINFPPLDFDSTKDQIFSSEAVTFGAFEAGDSHLNPLRRQLLASRFSFSLLS